MDHWIEAFRALGNPERLRLFFLLVQQGGGLCVCELVEALGVPQYQVSKHLHSLRRVGLIESIRVGRWAYYTVARSKRAKELSAFLQQVLPPSAISAELGRLRESLSLRVNGRCVLGRRPREGVDA